MSFSCSEPLDDYLIIKRSLDTSKVWQYSYGDVLVQFGGGNPPKTRWISKIHGTGRDFRNGENSNMYLTWSPTLQLQANPAVAVR